MKVSLNNLLDALRDGAWPPSARVVKCSVIRQRARPAFLVAICLFEMEHTKKTAFERMRKVQATVGLYASNPLGYTWHAMVGTSGCNSERRS